MFPLRDNIPHKNFPIVVLGIIIINILVFLFELSLTEKEIEILFNTYGFVPAMAFRHIWAVITSVFLHGSGAHLLGNLWFLWLFGDNVEDKMGPRRFLLFYLLCGVLAALAHFLSEPSSMMPVVGASGAIAGVMGAYLLMFKRAKILTFIPPFFFFPLPAWFYLIIWLTAQITSGAMVGYGTADLGVAFWAHVGGFIAGMLLYRRFIGETAETD